MSRTSNVVVCKEGSEEHVLSDNFPHSGKWIYCCNCQTFIAWNAEDQGISVRECPFCLSSLNPRMYACDNCAVTMLDFDDQTLRKHHTVLSWGMPQPACPGCHRFPQSTPRVHFCKAMGCNLSTARDRCPYCNLNTDEMAESSAVKTRGLVRSTVAETRGRDPEEHSAGSSSTRELRQQTTGESSISEPERPTNNNHPPETVRTGAPVIEVEKALALAEEEARARAAAEARAKEAEAKRLEAIRAAEYEAEMRAAAESKAREMAGIYTSRLSQIEEESGQSGTQDRVSIALYAAIATFLLLALIMLIYTMVSLYNP